MRCIQKKKHVLYHLHTFENQSFIDNIFSMNRIWITFLWLRCPIGDRTSHDFVFQLGSRKFNFASVSKVERVFVFWIAVRNVICIVSNAHRKKNVCFVAMVRVELGSGVWFVSSSLTFSSQQNGCSSTTPSSFLVSMLYH